MTLRELLKLVNNKEDIEYIVSFFAMHLNDSSSDHVLRQIKDDKAYKKMSSMIDELLSLDIKVNKKRLCTERSIDDFYDKGEEYYFDSYMMEKDADSHYSLDFIDWREVIDSKIDEHSLFKYGYLDVATSILWELSFLGFNLKTVEKELKELADTIDEEDQNEPKHSLEELFEELQADD